MSLRLFLAGPSRELDRVLPIVSSLDAAPCITITCRWWDAVQVHGVGGDAELSHAEQQRHANADLRGIRTADLVWLLWPETSVSNGVQLELGYALASRKPAIVSGTKSHACIYTALVERIHSDAEALSRVLSWASAGAYVT